ncbi:hypothetical protein [Sinorhizobium fredii]|uniref:Uncharacterized protein n=1 Tax=Rhizobium fredii TaxID=380 RepID=A0A2L0HBT8_RHIFR|nr:hypothetical protein [Sinorhizobium fredii]AUX78652.1 hypothetical protein NXT3_PA00366 [Sinorhizobium fredii]
MKHRSVRQLVLVLLAVFVAAGMGLSVAQASDMAARMATMSDMAMPDHGDCQGCPDQPGDGGMKAMACGNICAAPVIAPLPLAAALPAGENLAFMAAPDLFLNGRTLPPDPDPPRTSDIG